MIPLCTNPQYYICETLSMYQRFHLGWKGTKEVFADIGRLNESLLRLKCFDICFQILIVLCITGLFLQSVLLIGVGDGATAPMENGEQSSVPNSIPQGSKAVSSSHRQHYVDSNNPVECPVCPKFLHHHSPCQLLCLHLQHHSENHMLRTQSHIQVN